MSTAAGICPRCGSVAGTWHTRPQCDAAYDSAYRAALPSIGTSVTTSQAAIDAAVAAERDRLLGKVEALLPAWSGGDVVHEGGFSHSSALQCERCPGWPHASCVHPADLRALVAEERTT